MGVPVATLPPTPPPAPMTPPGVQPPPLPAPAPDSGGSASAPPGAPPSSPSAAPPDAGAGPPPAQDTGITPLADGTGQAAPPQGDPNAPRPRLIPGTDATEGKVPASPQEQQDLHQLMVKVGTFIHSRQSRDQVLDSLHQPNKTVAQAIGETCAHMLMAANQQKKNATQQPLDNDVLQEAALHVIPELLDLGISAGIFPIKPPAGGNAGDGQNTGPGVGSDDYNKALRFGLLEATKVYGESVLQQPNAKAISSAAGDMWQLGIRQEMANGTASPRYKAMVQSGQPAAAAPPALMPPAGGAAPGGAAPPPGGANG